ncbi:MAG: hypothetical protein IPN76_35480 [Saprospiraceae bacterium]|nr:hypothetical protein [Saprospiraceae bacterium]
MLKLTNLLSPGCKLLIFWKPSHSPDLLVDAYHGVADVKLVPLLSPAILPTLTVSHWRQRAVACHFALLSFILQAAKYNSSRSQMGKAARSARVIRQNFA